MAAAVTLSCPSCFATNRVPAQRLHENPVCGRCRASLFAGSPLTLTQSNYDRVVANTELPILIDFWAPWCGPCKMMAPIFAEAAGRLEPSFRLAKVDTEAEPQLAQRFQIRSIPTLLIIQNGREIARQAGAMDLGRLEQWARAQPVTTFS